MSTSPAKKGWGLDEDEALVRIVTQVLLQNRSEVYAAPGLEDFTGHGASKINTKLQQLLSKLCGSDIVKEEVEKMKGNRGGKTGTPTKKNGSPSKKRKVKEEEDAGNEE